MHTESKINCIGRVAGAYALATVRTTSYNFSSLNKYPHSAALTGLGLAIMVCETCNALESGPSCSSPLVDLLKAAGTAVTAATAALMLWQFSLTARRNATKSDLAGRHVRSRAHADPPTAALRTLGPRRLLSLAFVAANCVHAAPGVSGTVEIDMLGMMVPYRIEALVTVRYPSAPARPACPRRPTVTKPGRGGADAYACAARPPIRSDSAGCLTRPVRVGPKRTDSDGYSNQPGARPGPFF